MIVLNNLGDQNTGFPTRLPKLGKVKDWWKYHQKFYWKTHWLTPSQLNVAYSQSWTPTHPASNTNLLNNQHFLFLEHKWELQLKCIFVLCQAKGCWILRTCNAKEGIPEVYIFVCNLLLCFPCWWWSLVSMRLHLDLFQKWWRWG